MLLLLPPSETKVQGGVPGRTGYPALSFPQLDPIRHEAADALAHISRTDPSAAARMLKLGPKSVSEVEHNLSLDTGVLLPALKRYTGVLYAETGAADWSVDQWSWVNEHVAVQSSLWGLIRAGDSIPAYRLSASTRLGGLSMTARWASAVSEILESAGSRWILDARSGGYRELGPIPASIPSSYLEVVTKDGGAALNHFNKKHKGELVRDLVSTMPDITSADDFVSWGASHGLDLSLRGDSVVLAV